MSRPVRPFALASAAACLLAAMQCGCTSALTASYLRAGLWDGSEHAATTADDERNDDDGEPDAPEAAPADPVAERERREAALEEAMSRLSRLGDIDPAVEAALVATLQRTQPEDWPVVVEEFAASLTVAPPGAMTIAVASPPAPDEPGPTADVPAVAAKPAAAEAAPPDDAAAPDTIEPVAQSDTETPARVDEPAPSSDVVAAEEPPPSLAVRTACFASAVRAWGDLDRFTADRFRPGQEVIVYLELDNLAAGESPAGHTTCIDAALRIVDDSGATLHTWNFDPIAETCAARRRDYFARYVVRLPESLPPGAARIEVDVADTLAGATAAASLPLEVAAAE